MKIKKSIIGICAALIMLSNGTQANATVVRDCSYLQAGGKLVSGAANTAWFSGNNSNNMSFSAPVGTYILTQSIQSVFVAFVSPPYPVPNGLRGIIYENSGSNWHTNEFNNMAVYKNGNLVNQCRYGSNAYQVDSEKGDFCNNMVQDGPSNFTNIDNLVVKNDPIWGPTLRSYRDHSRGINGAVGTYQDTFQITDNATYMFTSYSTITSAEGAAAGTLGCANPAGARNDGGGHITNVCNACRIYVNPPSCTISGPASVPVGSSATYTVSPSGGNVAQLEVFQAPASTQSWATMYSGGAGSTSFNYTFSSPGTYDVVCNSSGPAPGNYWCSGNPSAAARDVSQVPDCGSAARMTVTVTAGAAPTAPTGITGTNTPAAVPTQVVLNWTDNATNETSYEVLIGPPTNANITGLAANTTSYTVNGVCDGTPRTYQIGARNAFGVSYSSFIHTCAPPPPTPTGFTATDDGVNDRVRLNWNDVPNETSYLLQIFNMDGQNISVPITGIVIPPNTTQYFDPGICGTAPRRYELRAVNGGGQSAPVTVTGLCSTVINQNNIGILDFTTFTPSGTINSLAAPEFNFRGTATPSQVSGKDGKGILHYTVTITDPVSLSPVVTQESMIVSSTTNLFDVGVPWPLNKRSAADPVPNARTVTVTFTLQSPSGTTLTNGGVPQTRSFTYTWSESANAYKPIQPALPTISGGTPYAGTLKEVSFSAPKQLDPFGPGFVDIDSSTQYLIDGSEYWVRLSLDGNTPVPATTQTKQNDIMLVLDVTGSMRSQILVNTGGTGSVQRIEAAKEALRQFASDADNNDYLGFGSYAICEPTVQSYNETQINIPWAYEGNNSGTGRHVGYGYLHVRPAVASSTRAQILSLLQSGNPFAFGGNGNITFCQNNYVSGPATDTGGGVVAGLSMITNVIQNQRRNSNPADNTLFSSSMGGSFPGPSFRVGTNRYIVLATDGEENIQPKAYSPQPLLSQLSPAPAHAVQYAANNNIKIYTLTIGHSSGSQATLMRNIARDTGGEYFPGQTQQELKDSYKKILTEIQALSSSGQVTVEERINPAHFDIVKLDAASYLTNFRITKAAWNQATQAYAEQDVTSQLCTTYANCISNFSATGVNFSLPQFEPSERYYIYFKVRAKGSTGGTLQNVDHDADLSQIVFPNPLTRKIANKQVQILSPEPFFTVSGNSVYSGNDINSMLILPTEKFIQDNKGVSISKTNQTFANGKVSDPKYQVENYTARFDTSFATMLKKFDSKVSFINLPAPQTSFDLSLLPAGTDTYSHISRTGNTKYIFNPPLTTLNDRRRRVIFIAGDLYISRNLTVQADGLTNVTFIVSGSVGFAPTVTRYDGIILADGTIDSACDNVAGFNNPAAPQIPKCNPTSVSGQLALNGMFFSRSGFELNHDGDPSIAVRTAGEQFTFRPDFYISATTLLGAPTISWKEIAK